MSRGFSPFYDPLALQIASKHFYSSDLLQEKEGTVLSSPFIKGRRYSLFQTLELAGREYADYRSILQPEDLDSLLALHERRFPRHIIDLGGLGGEDPSDQLIQDWMVRNNLLFHKDDLPRAPYISIDCSWEKFESSKKRKFWYNISRAERLLEENGKPLEFLILETPNEIAEHLPSCLSLYKKNWNRLTSSSIYLSERGSLFLHDFLKALSVRGMAEIVLLKQGDSLLAFCVGLKFQGIYYFYLFATNKDPHLAPYSVGKILIKNLLKSVFERNFKTFDFMAGEEPYKYEWTKSSQSRSNYYVTRNNLLNRFLLSIFVIFNQSVLFLKRNKLLRKALASINLLKK